MELALSLAVFLVMLLAAIAIAAGAVWIAVKLQRMYDHKLAQPRKRLYLACGRCGYRVEGWAGPICPECGTDRTQVPPTEVMERRFWHWVFEVSVAILIVVLAVVVVFVLWVWL